MTALLKNLTLLFCAPTRRWRRDGVAAIALPLLVLLAGGCASVPDTQFLMHRYVKQQARFKNAWGPVPARTSAAIMAELKEKAGNLDILDRQVTIEQSLTGASLVLGNKVTLLQDGPATYDAMFAAMRQAKDSINIETYIIEDGAIGQKFADILVERQHAGVQVNLIYDSVGALGTSNAFFDRLKQAGVQVLEFDPINPLARHRPWRINHRDHRKLLVVDGRTAFLGGVNISSVYSSGSSLGSSSESGSGRGGLAGSKGRTGIGWRDTDIQIDGPVVADFQRLFLQTWEKQHGPPLPKRDYLPVVPPQGSEIVRAIGTSPDDAYSLIYLTLISAITNAQKQVYITNAYFVPDPQLIDALLAAARRGVDVRIILPRNSDARSAFYAGRAHYAQLLKGGVKIYERLGPLLHVKTAIVDGVWSCVGSSNLDWRSAVDNDEINAVILSREFAQQMLAAYALDLASSDEVQLEEWQRRPTWERMKEFTFRMVGRLL